MKQWLLVIIFLTVAGLTAACGAGLSQTAPVQPESVRTERIQSESAQTEVTQAESAQAEFDQAESAQTESPQAQPAVPTFTTQSNSENAVWVDVTPLNLATGGDTLDFEVAFNTHSVDLAFDPADISIIRDGEGREYPAVAWEGSAPGGHHRRGVLQFEVPDYTTDFIEVVIQDVAGVPERVFHWDLTL
jgi:hypothetical protein